MVFRCQKLVLSHPWSHPKAVQEAIKVDSAATVKICWGANDGGRQQYYGEAGAAQLVAIHVGWPRSGGEIR